MRNYFFIVEIHEKYLSEINIYNTMLYKMSIRSYSIHRYSIEVSYNEFCDHPGPHNRPEAVQSAVDAEAEEKHSMAKGVSGWSA